MQLVMHAQASRQARTLGLRTSAEGAALPLWLADAPSAASASESLYLDPFSPSHISH